MNIVIVGGGDSALETAISLTSCGSTVTISYRKSEFNRPKPENIDKIQELVRHADAEVGVENPTSDLVSTSSGPFIPDRPTDDECEGCGAKLRGKPADGKCPGCGKEFHRKLGSLRLMMSSQPKEIREDSVLITNAEGGDEEIAADAAADVLGVELLAVDHGRRRTKSDRNVGLDDDVLIFLLARDRLAQALDLRAEISGRGGSHPCSPDVSRFHVLIAGRLRAP